MTGRRPAFALAAVAALFAGAAQAEWRLTPFVMLTQTRSDNVSLVADALARSGWITDIAPGIRLDATGGIVRGFLEYSRHEMLYSGDSRLNSGENFLASRFTVEAVKDRVFLDARANTTQESRSPFGTVAAPGEATASANRVETTTVQVSPIVRGSLGDFAGYQLRLSESSVSTNDRTLPDTRSTEWGGRLASASAGAFLNWSVEGTALAARNDVIGQLDDMRLRARLTASVLPQLRLWVGTGVDRTEFAGPSRESADTPGAGLVWLPSDRTQVSGLAERRFFGNGYSAGISHRTARTAWRLYSVKDAAILPGLTGSYGRQSLADLMADMLASSVPDPEARAEQARQRLAQSGLPASTALSSSLLSARPVIHRYLEASVVYQGATNTATLSASSNEEREFGVGLGGEAQAVGANDASRRGFTASWAHRFTPLTSGTVSFTRLRTDGLQASARFDTTVDPGGYRESAVFATLSYHP